jgi:hypothetical protein
LQYELVDLRRELDALRASAKEEVAKPAIDPDEMKAAVAASPAFVEMQYEAVDLRKQVDTMKEELTRLRGVFGSIADGS